MEKNNVEVCYLNPALKWKALCGVILLRPHDDLTSHHQEEGWEEGMG